MRRMDEACPRRGSKLGWAFVMGCPGCAGTAVFVLAPVLGFTAAGFKLLAAAMVLGLVAGLWIRNIWVRRGESNAAR